MSEVPLHCMPGASPAATHHPNNTSNHTPALTTARPHVTHPFSGAACCPPPLSQ